MIALRTSWAADRVQLSAIRRAAIDATHAFLASDNREEIEAIAVGEYIPATAFLDAGDGHVDPLFVHPDAHGRGVRRMLMAAADADTVDVNEQNSGAIGFYRSLGYTVAGHPATDDAGRPYPILHLGRRTPSKAAASGLYRTS